MISRPLNDVESEAFRLGRLVAAEEAPYFMHALFAATPVAAPGLGTFAVDASWRLYLDPDLLIGQHRWTTVTVAAVLLHEVGHLLRDHAARAAALPVPRHYLAWNLAADAEINDDLIPAGVALPDGAVTPAALGCVDGDLAENYYRQLAPDDPTDPQLPDDGAEGCGSGAGCPPVPSELPATDSEVGTPVSAAEADLIRRRVAHDVQSAANAKGRGSVPAGLSRWASEVLAPPTVAWDRILRATIRRAVADRAGRLDYTYSRPSRRRQPGLIKPAMRAPSVIVSIVVDTSGSMQQRDLDAAMSEVNGVLRSSGVAREHVRLLSCDAAAASARRVRSVSDVRLTGGGGTDMRIGIAAAEDASPAPHVVIVLTDGYTPWPDNPTRSRLICAVINEHEPANTPSWAAAVHIKPTSS